MATPSTTATRTEQWNLTAPESHVLLEGAQKSAQPFKLAVTELVARGALKLVQVGEGKRQTTVVTDGPTATRPTEAPLAAVWDVYKAGTLQPFPEATGVRIDELAKGARKAFGSLGGYVERVVVPSLIERGLYERVERRVLFVIPKTSLELTPTGRTKKEELEALLARGRDEFGGWVSNDSGRALAYVGAAGAAMLLLAPLAPDLQRLQAQTGATDLGWDFRDFGDSDEGPGLFDAIDDAFGGGDSDAGDSGGSDSSGSDD